MRIEALNSIVNARAIQIGLTGVNVMHKKPVSVYSCFRPLRSVSVENSQNTYIRKTGEHVSSSAENETMFCCASEVGWKRSV